MIQLKNNKFVIPKPIVQGMLWTIILPLIIFSIWTIIDGYITHPNDGGNLFEGLIWIVAFLVSFYLFGAFSFLPIPGIIILGALGALGGWLSYTVAMRYKKTVKWLVFGMSFIIASLVTAIILYG